MLKLREEGNEFQLFLILVRSSCKECSETSSRSALTKVQSLSLKAQEGYCCSHSNRSAGVAQETCKECAGVGSLRTYQQKGELKDCCCGGVHGVEEFKYFEVFEGFLQGVRIEVLWRLEL
jgi:hypothetical protein